jgi:AraC-like DNA-binding protein
MPMPIEAHHQGNPAVAGGVGTRLVGAFTAVPMLMRQFGVDPAPVFACACLVPKALDDPAGRVDYEALLRLLNLAAADTGCAHFGLRVGSVWHLQDMGLLGELVRHSPTVGAALHELVTHHHLNSEGALAFLAERGGFADLGYAVYLPFGESVSQLYDAVLSAIVNFMRDLCGDGWRPTAVFLAHAAPADVTPYRHCFHAPLHFSANACAVRFPARWLAGAVAGADPQRLRLARAKAEAIGGAALVEQVHRTLRTLLLYGKSSGADVARSLAMHRRTLDRRLNAEGTTFQRVLDRVRIAVAKELLEDSRMSMPDIAAALGYAEDVSFIRAFRRWTGTTPAAWRVGQLAGRLAID